MDEQKMHTLLTNILQLENPRIEDVCPAPEGMTNDSYFVTVNDEKFVVRIPGKGTEELLIDRKREKENLIFATNLGINPELYYFDVKSGIKITRKLRDFQTLTREMAQDWNVMEKIIALLQRLHFSGKKMKHRFDLFGMIRHYENLVQSVCPFMMKKLTKLRKEIHILKKVYEQMKIVEVPCHIDVVPANVIFERKEKIYLIDWEYSGMFDPFWDLATLFMRLEFTREDEMLFLKRYLGRIPNEKEFQRILLHKIFQDYLWYLWTIIKENGGEDFGILATEYLERAINNLKEYHTTYGMDVVI